MHLPPQLQQELERELSKISPAELAGASAELTASYRTSGSQPAGHVKFQLCAQEGLKAETISRKQKERYRAARKWGDSWSPLSNMRTSDQSGTTEGR